MVQTSPSFAAASLVEIAAIYQDLVGLHLGGLCDCRAVVHFVDQNLQLAVALLLGELAVDPVSLDLGFLAAQLQEALELYAGSVVDPVALVVDPLVSVVDRVALGCMFPAAEQQEGLELYAGSVGGPVALGVGPVALDCRYPAAQQRFDLRFDTGTDNAQVVADS